MLASKSRIQLKVLNQSLADRLSVFNTAARALQAQGIRIQGFYPAENILVISPESGQGLVKQGHSTGYTRHKTAGSTHFSVLFQGVTLKWRESISASRPSEWSRPTLH